MSYGTAKEWVYVVLSLWVLFNIPIRASSPLRTSSGFHVISGIKLPIPFRMRFTGLIDDWFYHPMVSSPGMQRSISARKPARNVFHEPDA